MMPPVLMLPAMMLHAMLLAAMLLAVLMLHDLMLPALTLPAMLLPAMMLPAMMLPALMLLAMMLCIPALKLPAMLLPAMKLQAMKLPAMMLPALSTRLKQLVVQLQLLVGFHKALFTPLLLHAMLTILVLFSAMSLKQLTLAAVAAAAAAAAVAAAAAARVTWVPMVVPLWKPQYKGSPIRTCPHPYLRVIRLIKAILLRRHRKHNPKPPGNAPFVGSLGLAWLYCPVAFAEARAAIEVENESKSHTQPAFGGMGGIVDLNMQSTKAPWTGDSRECGCNCGMLDVLKLKNTHAHARTHAYRNAALALCVALLGWIFIRCYLHYARMIVIAPFQPGILDPRFPVRLKKHNTKQPHMCRCGCLFLFDWRDIGSHFAPCTLHLG